MKKISSVLLAGLMIVSLTACGSSNTSSAGASTVTSETEVPDSTTEPEERASSPDEATESGTGVDALVVYFSWSSSHNTQTMAEYVSEAADGELFRLEPETPYTTDYNAVIDVAQEELSSNARPVIAQNLTQEQIDAYNVIFIGYPVWWYDAPMIIYSFMESLDLSGKTVATFATSGGSGISDSKLKAAVSANYLDGLCISNFSAGEDAQNRVNAWVDELGYSK